jgi:hypothetical protein
LKKGLALVVNAGKRFEKRTGVGSQRRRRFRKGLVLVVNTWERLRKGLVLVVNTGKRLKKRTDVGSQRRGEILKKD